MMKALLFALAVLMAVLIWRRVRIYRSRKKLLARARDIASLCLAVVLLAAALSLAGLPIPGGQGYAVGVAEPSGSYVSDYADIISGQTEQYINEASAELERQSGGAELMVVTVPDLGGMDIKGYSQQLMRDWGVGADGVVVLVSMNPRNVRIEVGSGLEGRLNNAVLGRILEEYTLPFLREDDFDQGIAGAYTAIFSEVCNEYGLDPADLSSGITQMEQSGKKISLIQMAIMLGMVIVIAAYFRKGKKSAGTRGGNSVKTQSTYGMGHHRGRSRGINGNHRNHNVDDAPR